MRKMEVRAAEHNDPHTIESLPSTLNKTNRTNAVGK